MLVTNATFTPILQAAAPQKAAPCERTRLVKIKSCLLPQTMNPAPCDLRDSQDGGRSSHRFIGVASVIGKSFRLLAAGIKLTA